MADSSEDNLDEVLPSSEKENVTGMRSLRERLCGGLAALHIVENFTSFILSAVAVGVNDGSQKSGSFALLDSA